MSITGITPITNTNTFGQWKDRTNEIIEALEDAITLGDAANNTGNVVITGNITASNTVITDTISPLDNSTNIITLTSSTAIEGDISVDNTLGGVAKISLKDSGATTWEIESDISHNNLNITKGVVTLTLNESAQELTGTNIVIDSAILPTIDASDLTDTQNRFFSKSYNDLTDKPSIPSDVSDLTDNSDAIPEDVTDLADSTNSLLPSGVIVMWSGSTSNIPQGWNLCDGTNGTPNLLDRFIVGAGGDYNVGETGGQDSVTLTASQMPSHSHSVDLTTDVAGAHSHTYVDFYPGVNFGLAGGNPGGTISRTGTTSVAGDHSHTITGNTEATGGGAAHENRPPYYALAYIMKS